MNHPTTAESLWAEYLDLPSEQHSILAGYLAQYVIQSDPDLFARVLAEAKAVAAAVSA